MIRQHAEWLRDASVDFILVDWSNDIDYEPTAGAGLGRTDLAAIEVATVPLFEVFASVPNAPRIAILSGPGLLTQGGQGGEGGGRPPPWPGGSFPLFIETVCDSMDSTYRRPPG